MTSVRPYLIHDERYEPEICTTTVGFGGRPWPSHNKLSHEITHSHSGASVISNRENKSGDFYISHGCSTHIL